MDSSLVMVALTRRIHARHPESAAERVPRPSREIVFRTTDEQELGAWLIAGAENQPCTIVLHGQGSRRSQRTHTINWLTRRASPLWRSRIARMAIRWV